MIIIGRREIIDDWDHVISVWSQVLIEKRHEQLWFTLSFMAEFIWVLMEYVVRRWENDNMCDEEGESAVCVDSWLSSSLVGATTVHR